MTIYEHVEAKQPDVLFTLVTKGLLPADWKPRPEKRPRLRERLTYGLIVRLMGHGR